MSDSVGPKVACVRNCTACSLAVKFKRSSRVETVKVPADELGPPHPKPTTNNPKNARQLRRIETSRKIEDKIRRST
jgi:hypothetical protein